MVEQYQLGQNLRLEIWLARASDGDTEYLVYLLPQGIAWDPWQQRRRKT